MEWLTLQRNLGNPRNFTPRRSQASYRDGNTPRSLFTQRSICGGPGGLGFNLSHSLGLGPCSAAHFCTSVFFISSVGFHNHRLLQGLFPFVVISGLSESWSLKFWFSNPAMARQFPWAASSWLRAFSHGLDNAMDGQTQVANWHPRGSRPGWLAGLNALLARERRIPFLR